MRKQSSGWWIILLLVALVAAYAIGGLIRPALKQPAQQKVNIPKPSVAPVVAPLEPSKSKKPEVKNKAADDVQVEVIETKPSQPAEPKPVTKTEESSKPERTEPKPSEAKPAPKKLAEPVHTDSKQVKHMSAPVEHSVVKHPEPKHVTAKRAEPAVQKPKPVVKQTTQPKVQPPKAVPPKAKQPAEKKVPNLPVQQPTKLDDQSKLPPVKPAAGVYRVMAATHYKSHSEAQSALTSIRSHVPGASIVKSSNGYAVQLAQYRVKQNVNKFAAELKSKGVAYVVR